MSGSTSSQLDAYRKDAKRLKKAWRSGDSEAAARIRSHVPDDRPLKHADFLFVIAREAGHDNWPKLKLALEAAAMTREERVHRLRTALYFGQHWVTERLLADDPELAVGEAALELALYDLKAVEARIAADPSYATTRIGRWLPLAILATSKEIQRSPEKQAGMMAIAELLVAGGADVDTTYSENPENEERLSSLYGALCHADNFELGKWLLEKGANPNDYESLYHATELPHTRALELLIEHKADPKGTNALARAIDFREIEKVKLLLEAGANPDEAVLDHPSGQPIDTIPALHQAARRWCPAEIAKLLLDHGAGPNRVWNGHSPYATARIYGNDEVAEMLAANGAATELSGGETRLADCARGVLPDAPIDPSLLNGEDKLMLTRVVFQEDRLPHLKALVAAGLDPDLPDEMGLIPLHSAGWAGLPDAVAFLLTLGPDLAFKNAYGGDALDTVIHGSEHRLDADERDHIGCARLLLEAGSELRPEFISGCGNEEMAAFLEDWQAEHLDPV